MSKLKILLVDDDAKLSALMATVLEKAGNYEVRQENRSFAALATARAFLPKLVLLDVDMPGQSGGDVAAELARDPILRHVPVVFVTSLVSNADLNGPLAMRGGVFLSRSRSCPACCSPPLAMSPAWSRSKNPGSNKRPMGLDALFRK